MNLDVCGFLTCCDCGVEPGQPHEPGCDVERCTVCKGQRLQCECQDHDQATAAFSQTGRDPGPSEQPGRSWR